MLHHLVLGATQKQGGTDHFCKTQRALFSCVCHHRTNGFSFAISSQIQSKARVIACTEHETGITTHKRTSHPARIPSSTISLSSPILPIATSKKTRRKASPIDRVPNITFSILHMRLGSAVCTVVFRRDLFVVLY
ncbi:unnamed protein product, partial [Ixodes pacificus]